MSAHTPGPWVARKDPNGFSTDWCIGVADDVSPVDYVAVCARRDAPLIAAAPELLEALRYAEAFIAIAVPSTARDREEAINEVLPAIRAAIAKATGNG